MSGVIFKQSFKHPNLKSSSQNNVGHVFYIGTRAGVDISAGADAHIEQQSMEGFGSKGNWSETDLEDELRYAKYIGERPNSHGLFGRYGVEDLESVQEEIGNHNSFVWRTIISLKENDAIALDYTEKKNWQMMLRSQMPNIADKMDIKYSNMRWVGAVHMEKGHPHVHVMYWEKEPKRMSGIASKKSLEGMRKVLTDEIFEEQRLTLLNEKNALRDLIKEIGVKNTGDLVRLRKEIDGYKSENDALMGERHLSAIPLKIYSETEIVLSQMLKDLSNILPSKGRLAYAYMPPYVKHELDILTERVLDIPEFNILKYQHLKTVEKLTRLYTGKEADIKKALDNAEADIKKRLAQTLLKGAGALANGYVKHINQKELARAVRLIKASDTPIDRTIEYEKAIKTLAQSFLQAGYNEDGIEAYLKYCLEDKVNGEFIHNVVKEVQNDFEPVQRYFDNKKNRMKLAHSLSYVGLDDKAIWDALINANNINYEYVNQALTKLKYDGLVDKDGLTEQGFEVFSHYKDLSVLELDILNKIDEEGSIGISSNITHTVDEILEHDDISDRLKDTKPREFEVVNMDKILLDLSDDDNVITDEQIENYVRENNDIEGDLLLSDELEKDIANYENIDQQVNLLKNRLLVLRNNRYVSYDKEKDAYTFENKAVTEIGAFKSKYTFGRYDAKVTMGYFDEEGNLTLDDLAKNIQESINDDLDEVKALFERVKEEYYKDDNALLVLNKEGWNMLKANRLFDDIFKRKKTVKLKSLTKEDIETLKNSPYVTIDNEKGIASIDSKVIDFDKVNKMVYKANLEENVPSVTYNTDDWVDSHYKSYKAFLQVNRLKWRFQMLSKEGLLRETINGYSITQEGIEARNDILNPQRKLLKNQLKYLEKCGFVQSISVGGEMQYKVTNRYAQKKDNMHQRVDTQRSPYSTAILKMIDESRGMFTANSFRDRTNYSVTKDYYDGKYKDLSKTYEQAKENLNIRDMDKHVIETMTQVLLIAEMTMEDVYKFVHAWNDITQSNMTGSMINKVIDMTINNYQEDLKYGRYPDLTEEDLRDFFKALGVKDSEIPKSLYGYENYSHTNTGMLVKDIINGAYREMKKNQAIEEASGKKLFNQAKRDNIKENKSLAKKESKKNKSSSLGWGREFE